MRFHADAIDGFLAAPRIAARGAAVEPRRVIITAGAQQALALAGASLGGARIAVGDATYPAALGAFAAAGAQVVRDRGAARYAIAGVSNPHGVELASRDELLARNELLIVDEAYAELRFDGRMPRPLVGDVPDREALATPAPRGLSGCLPGVTEQRARPRGRCGLRRTPCARGAASTGTSFAGTTLAMRPRLRVMSYNIRNGRGCDDRVDLDRIAAVIAPFDPDIVALQEVDAGRARSGGLDQGQQLASQLGMSAHFTACIEHECERYGIATLTRLPVITTRHIALPALAGRRGSQPRRALVTRLRWPHPDRTLDMMNTHLSIVGAERPLQVAAITDGLEADDVVVAGDLNCMPWSAPFRALRGRLRSATGRARSWPARAPLFAIDHILYRGPLAVVEGGSWTAAGARRASDHLPVVAVLEYVARAEAA